MDIRFITEDKGTARTIIEKTVPFQNLLFMEREG
jgi:hypothetical protein